MEGKWIAIMAIGMFAAMFAGIGLSEYSMSKCKIAYVQSNKTADEIKNICK